jgi:patatin-like phospholipase/acyl hydrolase
VKTLLSLDGGGLRGIVSLGLISQLEDRLDGAPLSTHFDLVGGTSTGAVIATGLALGMQVRDKPSCRID